MKKYTIVLFAFLCIFAYCSGDDEENDHDTESECDQKDSASKATDCNKLKVCDGYQYCCYMHSTSNRGTYKGCTELTKEEYNDIKKYISELEEESKDSNGKIKEIDCNSARLGVGLLILLLILF